MTTATEITARTPFWPRLGRLVVRVLRFELLIYVNIGRALFRRPAIPAGASGFGYQKPVQTILILFIALSAIEIPIVDLIVHRWPAVRIMLLIVGIWGVTWMTGLLCAYVMRPHTVGPDGIRVRDGLETDVPLSWDDIASVERLHHTDEPKSPKVDGDVLALRMQDETNIQITLEGPTVVRLPGRIGVQSVHSVRLWVDDPQAFLGAVRAHIP